MFGKRSETARIELGQKVRDRITGIDGIVIARTEWLHGCTRITFQPEKLKDGKPVEPQTIDEAQLEVVNTKNPFAKAPAHRPAGPKPSPTRQAAPIR